VNDRVGTYHIPQVAQHTKYMPWTQLCAEEQANTRLIAAAPALLEALERAVASEMLGKADDLAARAAIRAVTEESAQ
jgi:hypothetical protein